MSTVKTGKAHVAVRARLMILLGEQLITDEIAAVSELVKNAYDADATKMEVILHDVSKPQTGYILVKDDGHGMTTETVLSCWLELGTSSKARGHEGKVKFSEFKNRIYLGEKGLGRLAVHKLGSITELVTRRKGSDTETKLTLDWTAFEDNEQLLDEVPVTYEVTPPRIFTTPEFPNGTQITIRKLQRQWSSDMMLKAQKSLMAMKSPFAQFSDFAINIIVEDKEKPNIEEWSFAQLIEKATYKFEAEIDEKGLITYQYNFDRPDLAISRKENKKLDIRDPDDFPCDRKPLCGPFKLRLYCWDLALSDQKAVFGDTSTYQDFIRPNTGIKVFRDGFRVLPYGNTDNDWLSMDMRRVKRFENNVSRNQIIGTIEISLATSPKLVDKTDREGLIDNNEFRDFRSLILTALSAFQNERYPDKRKVKELTGRLKDENSVRTVFTRTMAMLSTTIGNDPKLSAEIKLQINHLVEEARAALDTMLSEREQPLLVAASIGLTYMMPTHEARRELHEAMRLLRNGIDEKSFPEAKTRPILSLLRQTDETIQGIGRLMQQTREDEIFQLEDSVDDAIELMAVRFKRNSIVLEKDIRQKVKTKGSERLVTIMLLNFLDNSLYWLLRKKPDERKVKVIVTLKDENPVIIVSDSGPGFVDEIKALTLPFFTRKPKGMGLGLYISDRIAQMNGGHLRILNQTDFPNLYSGANIAVIFKKT